MADEDNFPTAIIPTRPGSFERRYDDLAREFGDPLKKMFLLQAGAEKEEVQLNAAARLVERRYPKPAPPPALIQAQEGSRLTINLLPAAPPGDEPDPTDPVADAIDVTPVGAEPAALPETNLEDLLK